MSGGRCRRRGDSGHWVAGRRGRRRARRLGGRRRGGASASSDDAAGRDAEPFKVESLMHGNSVADTGSGVSNHLAAVGRHRVSGLRIVLGGCGGGRADAKDVGPLEDLLGEVLVIEGSVAENRFE